VARLALLLLGIFLGSTTICLVAGLQLGNVDVRDHDIFAPYADILPGQPFSHVEKYGFECVEDASAGKHCLYRPTSGLFDIISLRGQGRVIQYVAFGLRRNNLVVGNLLTLWGQPNIIALHQTQVLR
jgi:hypothetical protein